MTRSFSRLMLGVVGASLVLVASQVSAGVRLIQSRPTANATVIPPKQISMTFSEKLDAKTSAGELMTTDGKDVASTSSVGGKDGTVIVVTPKAPLASGSYMVMWRGVSSDGHEIKGDYDFTVQ